MSVTPILSEVPPFPSGAEEDNGGETPPTSPVENLSLHPAHLADLRASGLSDETIRAAGIFSLPPDPARWNCYLNPHVRQKATSAYVIPYPHTGGTFWRVKPFPPVTDGNGHVQKYDQPSGCGVRLYIPPGVGDSVLKNPGVALRFTEGEKKALMATQEGFPTVALGGLWNFLTDGQPVADLDTIDLVDRECILTPDADVWTRRDLLQAVYVFGRILEERGTKVVVEKLPAPYKLDDFLVARGPDAMKDLPRYRLRHKAFAETAKWWREWCKRRREERSTASAVLDPNPDPHSTAHREADPYRVEGGCIVREKQTQHGVIIEPLSNFTARVTEELILDDGVESTRAFLTDGRLESGEILPVVRIPASRFPTMGWVTENWGLRAVVRAGQTTRDCLREAIQRLSPEAQRRHVFAHTGWREVGGEWVYLTASGAVGRDGFDVDLGSELARYRLPRVVEDRVEAMRRSLRLFSVAPLHVTAPLWSAVYRAPLASAYPADLSLWIEGQTGSLKSTLAALFLCHFGDFDRTHLPGTWSSTANHLERRAFILKDALFVVDDYAPSGLDIREMETKAARLLRSQGNLAGRGRLRSDLSDRPAFPPRGLILSTGEQHPPGQSLLARTLLVDLEGSDVDLVALTEAQREAAQLPHAMAGYIAWLTPQMPTIPALLRKTFEGARARSIADGEHLRIPEVLAHLWLGLHCGLTCAEEIGACSASEAEDLRGQGWEALLSLGRAQGRLVEEERPTRRFLRVLLTLITQRRVLLLPRDEGGEGFSDGPPLIGWQDEEALYLTPEAAVQAVGRFCRDGGEPFPFREERLKRDLAKEGLSECDPGR